jgi:hypothetical protein
MFSTAAEQKCSFAVQLISFFVTPCITHYFYYCGAHYAYRWQPSYTAMFFHFYVSIFSSCHSFRTAYSRVLLEKLVTHQVVKKQPAFMEPKYSPPIRWPHEWLKHVSTYYVIKSYRKHRSWQSYSNEKDGLQQIQMESCQPIKRLKDKKKKKMLVLIP